MNATPAATFAAPDSAAFAAAPVRLAWHELVPHRAALVRFAQRKLLDPVLAEDLVHDVFEAVITGRAVFAGRSALRSWLTAILKHKIVDLVRERSGHLSLDARGADDDGEAETGFEFECPQPRPDEVATQRERLAQTLARIEHLPAGLRDVMRLRVLQDLPTDEVCASLAISEENLFVRLHRARRQLLS